MSKWISNDAIRGAELLLKIKQAALDDPLENPITQITGCGVTVVAKHLDALLMDWIQQTSDCAEYKRMYTLYRSESLEWDDFGFDKYPSEYSAERQAELRTLAKRWNDEDEASMDEEDLKEIEERRAKREGK